jgi:serine/threonine-protein kinase
MSGIARGKRVGRYELVQVLGEGGMGTVWLAHPYDAPDQLFAVKTVSAQYTSDARVCTMFVKEASLAAAIDHPNVVRLYDVGLHEDIPFFVMEWIDGYSLRDVVRVIAETGEPMPPHIALRIASDLCAGLHAAHELHGEDGAPLNLVHRDVSPHNVLVTREGLAKLIDFGVAKARDLATGNEASICAGLKGKVRYMAPEQALDKTIDRRADLFSVGAIVYSLLTGRAPFEGPNELAIINALLSTNPVYVPEDLPEPVQWILRRALSRRPDQRFADAAEMQNAIELALVELAQPDGHAEVADYLAWLNGEEEDETTSEHRAGAMRPDSSLDARGTQASRNFAPSFPALSPETAEAPRVQVMASPPIAFAMPGEMSVPARQSELPDDDPRPVAAKYTAQNAGSLRFVLAGAGFVGLLGIGAAFLVHDAPSSRRTPVREAAAQIENPPLSGASTIVVPSGGSPTTPIIELGDLDDAKPSSPDRARPRARRAAAGTALPVPNGGSPPPPPATTKNGDLAGSIKVWK